MRKNKPYLPLPFGDRYLLESVPKPPVDQSIIIPDSAKPSQDPNAPKECTVIRVGTTCGKAPSPFGADIPAEGDIVLWSGFGGVRVERGTRHFVIVASPEILAIVERAD